MVSSSQTDTRIRILQETWRLMEEKRGIGVRLEDIAKAAKVSRQAIYMHFGSRAGLLIETARYLDETKGHLARTQHIRETKDSIYALDALVEFWAGYIPDIYGLAKALMNARAADQDAASAWEDRMEALREKCVLVVDRLAQENLLTSQWSVDIAADFVWATLSIANWEHLILERGWSQQAYVTQIQFVLRRALLNLT
jgi:AcrR family transcriptional regulator